MRARHAALALCLGLGSFAAGQAPEETPPLTTEPATPPPAAPPAEAEEPEWSFYSALYTYILPDARDYVQPTFAADRGWLHLELRYNYEAPRTGSAWFGYNFSGGTKLSWEVTPIVGGFFGEMNGMAPGYKGSLGWWKLLLYSEGEWAFDFGHSPDSFFYSWSELTISPLKWFRVGLVAQHTRLVDTDTDIQRGLLLGLSYKDLEVTTSLFDLEQSKPVIVVGVAFSF